jgi:hypothetical protein
MPSLSDIISSAMSQVKQSTASSGNSVKQTFSGGMSSAGSSVANVVPNYIKNQVGGVTGGVSQAINLGLKDLSGAANAAAHGDFSGGLSQLSKGPSDILGQLGKTFGISSGSTMSGPGAGGAAQPGNSLAGAMARTDPMMSYLWYAIMPDVTPIGGSPVSLPWYYVEEATVPFRNFETRSRFVQGHQEHYPGPYSVDNLTLHLYGDTTNAAIGYLQAWNGAIVNPIPSAQASAKGGGYGRSKDYKKDINIYILGPDKRTLFQITYQGCWPTNVASYSLDSNTSTRIVNVVTFSVDDVYINAFAISKTLAASIDPFNTDNLQVDAGTPPEVPGLSDVPDFSATA